MTIYIYPKIQNVILNTVFLMKDAVSPKQFDSYEIQYRLYGSVLCGYILHEELDTLMRSNKIKITVNQNFAEGEPFIKIPIKYLKTC